MTHHDFWTDRLSDWIDGDLPAREAASTARHLEECDACRRTASELRELRDRAAALRPAEPDADLWPAIAARLGEDALAEEVIDLTARLHASPARETSTAREIAATRSTPHRIRLSISQLAVAAVVVLLGGWTLGTVTAPAPQRPATAERLVETGPVVRQASALVGEETLRARVDELEQAVNSRRGELAPETLAVLERNLALIDRVLAESVAALEAEPESQYLREHIQRSLQLREAALASTVRHLDRAD